MLRRLMLEFERREGGDVEEAVVPFPGMTQLDPGVDIGHVHLKVADLERAIGFYRDVLGFDLMQQMGDQAAFLSAGGYHHHIGLNTWESKGGSPPPPGTTGLYHVAIRYPIARGAGRRAEAARRQSRADLRRLRSRRERGDLPARSGRQRDRALPRPAAGGVADGARRQGRGDGQRFRSTSRRCSPRRPDGEGVRRGPARRRPSAGATSSSAAVASGRPSSGSPSTGRPRTNRSRTSSPGETTSIPTSCSSPARPGLNVGGRDA